MSFGPSVVEINYFLLWYKNNNNGQARLNRVVFFRQNGEKMRLCHYLVLIKL